MASYEKAVESYKKAVTTAASVAASAMLLRGVVNELLPHEVRDFVFSGIHDLRSRMSSQHTIVIEQTEGYANNQIYEAAKLYLATRINTNMRRLRVSRADETKSVLISMEEGEEMADVHEGTEFKWELVRREASSGTFSNGNPRQIEVRSFELSFHKKHKEKALHSYLPFILARAKELKQEDRALKLYMNDDDSWYPIDLHHPSTFDTLAMDPELKRAVMDDLSRFVKRKDYYKRIGKAWKRGYLLYGPPCHFEQVTLSGLLNFVDGLWSTSGEERIVVFTTNYKERLDPALLRPGRMDMHIHMSYCGVDAFRVLASNYHAINDHELFPEIEGLIQEVEVAPAAVAEELMRSDDTDAALEGLLDFLKAKRECKNEDKVEEQNVEDKDDGENLAGATDIKKH